MQRNKGTLCQNWGIRVQNSEDVEHALQTQTKPASDLILKDVQEVWGEQWVS